MLTKLTLIDGGAAFIDPSRVVSVVDVLEPGEEGRSGYGPFCLVRFADAKQYVAGTAEQVVAMLFPPKPEAPPVPRLTTESRIF